MLNNELWHQHAFANRQQSALLLLLMGGFLAHYRTMALTGPMWRPDSEWFKHE
ncbi:MAG: hypothetical protein KDI43_07005 [Gammaproteobacteria bacterium]|nr:hypothetical protein [Gammaproteobacteria bacterium]MCP5443840.1 hypothetical protein [Chromatiaceae bacterium]